MFENSIFKIEFSILSGFFPHHNLYRLIFQSFVLREYFGTENCEFTFLIFFSIHSNAFYTKFKVYKCGKESLKFMNV